jgi:hypothetical protein
MSDSASPSPDQPADHQLTDRVIARIRDAHRTAPRGRRTDTDVRALRRVFLDFGKSYRSYRLRTGEPVSTDVRDAALRFRRELDLLSLVSVAASLERLDRGLVG